MGKAEQLAEIFNRAGGLARVAEAAGVSNQEVRLWAMRGFVPVIYAVRVAEVAKCCPLDLVPMIVAREVRAGGV